MTDLRIPAIKISGLNKAFGHVVAVDGLDLEVEAGSFFGFLGPNGAGKSTTIKILTGMILPTSGNAAILGHDVVDDAVAAKQITGVVSEDGALFERLNGAEYLEFVGRMYGMERDTIRTRILDRLPSAVGAVADKELRYLFQSGTGRTSLLVMPVMTALPALLAGRHGSMTVFGLDLQLAVFLGVMIYATALTGYLQVNAFAWEGAGIGSYFTAPVRPEEVLLGKNLGIWILNLSLGVEGLLVYSVVRGIPDISTVLTGMIVLGSMSVILSMMGNFTSIAFPESRPVSSLTSSASPTGTLMMIGCLLLGVTCAGVVVFGAGLLGMPALQPVFALVIFIAVVGAYRLTLSPAARTLSDRRDDVFRALGSG